MLFMRGVSLNGQHKYRVLFVDVICANDQHKHRVLLSNIICANDRYKYRVLFVDVICANDRYKFFFIRESFAGACLYFFLHFFEKKFCCIKKTLYIYIVNMTNTLKHKHK